MHPDSSKLLVTVAAIGFATRLAVGVATGGLWQPEVNEYAAIARNMLKGQGFTYGHLGTVYQSYAAPMHAWLTAGSYWLTGTLVPLMGLQALAGGALAAVAAALAGRIFTGWIASATAGVLVAIHPGLIVYSATKAHPLIFDALFFALALLMSYRLAEQPTLARASQLGVTIGLGALSRATIVVFLPIIAMWLLWAPLKRSRAVAVRIVIVAGACTAAVIAPWTFRNSQLHDRFVFMVTTDSEAFWRGNNPYATGHSYVDKDRIVLDLLPAGERQEIEARNELGQSEWFAQQARQFITSRPGEFLRLTAVKFLHFWWYAPQTGVLYPRAWFGLYLAYYVAALAFAAAGVWTVVQFGSAAANRALLLGAFLLALSGLQSLYYVEGRHRWAIEPMLLVLSGGGIAAIRERRPAWPAATHPA